MKVVVIRFSSLGDCVLLCPFLGHLKHSGVQEITVVTRRAFAEVFAAATSVDRVIAIDDKAGWRGIRQIVGSLRNRGNLVIDAHASTRSRLVAAGLGGAVCSVKKYYRQRLALILFKKPCRIPTIAERYSALGEQLGLPPVSEATGGIDVPALVMERIGRKLVGDDSPLVAVAPGSRWPMKRWGAAKFAELVRRLVDNHGCRVVLLGDERDANATRTIASGLEGRVTDLTGSTGILEAAAAIRHSIAFIGNDSGLMHLAEAVDVPVIALFGPTVEEFGYFPSLPASRVVERDIPCRPCSRNGSRPCPKGTQECLVEIPVAPVEKAFADLAKAPAPVHGVSR